MHKCFTRFRSVVWITLLGAMFPGVASALILYGGDTPEFNADAPTGIYEDSGWQYQGIYAQGLGTAISPTHFITAAHLPLSSWFFYDGQSYTVDFVNYQDISGTDLRIFQVTDGTFADYAPLYDGALSAGDELVMMGRGAFRGDEVIVAGDAKGWELGSSDFLQRWGTNELEDLLPTGVGPMLLSTFDDSGGPNEASFSPGDSGGGVFVYDAVDGRWELVGMNYAATLGPYREDPLVPGEYYATLYDTSGMYEYDFDTASWVPSVDPTGYMLMSDLTANRSTIQAMLVPEPGSALFCLTSLGIWVMGRRRR
ncbi:trypsin-like peptidase domain-containing protein [Phragmitibacter flavus]|uniref:trypsin-like peptidase domain-containing protein n=1 Tax=Phragmitibacter flavus TaxID=2576071 RepID=UPI0010FE48CB|nr:trypsin-like peptidase domain-containing protein [Phragmitibacter flavus]